MIGYGGGEASPSAIDIFAFGGSDFRLAVMLHGGAAIDNSSVCDEWEKGKGYYNGND